MKLPLLPRVSRRKLIAASIILAVAGALFAIRGHVAALTASYLGIVGLDASGGMVSGDAAHAEEKPMDHGESHGTDGAASAGTALPAQAFEPPSRRSAVIGAIRDLIRTQAQAALGQEDAVKTQIERVKSISMIAAKLEGQDLFTEDVEALSLYALSGGSGLALAHLPERLKMRERDKALLEGAIHFSLGNIEAAAPLLRNKKLGDYPRPLAAMVALAQFQTDSQLTSEDKLARLGFAANIMPGTLVEEAALRRLIGLAADLGQKRRFYAAALRYLRRFPKSPYSSAFQTAIFAGVMKLETGASSGRRRGLDGLLAALPAAAKIDLLNHVSREALRSGKTALCSYAAERARGHAAMATASQSAQFRLYAMACLAPQGETIQDTAWVAAAGGDLTPADKRLAAAVDAIQSLIWHVPASGAEDDRPPRHEEAPAIAASVAQHLRVMQDLIEKAKP